jgi:PAS domain S-box-containing protein
LARDVLDTLAQSVLYTSSDAIIAADTNGIIRFWNPGAERIFEFSSLEAVNQSLDIIIPEGLRQRHWDGYQEVMKTGRSRYGQGDVLSVPGIKKNGDRISIEFTVVLLRNEIDQLIGIAAILRDVTERFEEMRALKRSASVSST